MALTTPDYFAALAPTGLPTDPQKVGAFLEAASAIIESYCGRTFAYSASITEYYTTTGTRFFALKRRPVWSIASIYLDYPAAFGSAPDAFPADSVLVSGTDYALAIDQADGTSMSGLVEKINGSWPMRDQVHELGRLFNEVTEAYGNLKVTYAGGYQEIPADLQYATCALAAEMYRTLPYGGALKSERLGQASYEAGGRELFSMPSLARVRTILGRYKDLPW